MLHTMLHVTPPSPRLTLTPVTLVTYGSCETVPGLQAEEDQAVAGYNLSPGPAPDTSGDKNSSPASSGPVSC